MHGSWFPSTAATRCRAIRGDAPLEALHAWHLQAALRTARGTGFENTIARGVLLNRMRSLALEGMVVSDAEVEAEYKRRNDKSSIEYVKIDPAALRAQAQVTPQEIRDHFNKNAATFRIEEKRSLLLVVLDPALIEAAINVSDDEVRRAYEQNKDRMFYETAGCKDCNYTGYRGRKAITEFLDLSDHIREMILEKRPSSEIRKAAIAEGMTTLRQSAVAKVLAGETTLKEINRVTFIE